jgi:hypothetical protein
MKITKSELREIIREEVDTLHETNVISEANAETVVNTKGRKLIRRRVRGNQVWNIEVESRLTIGDKDWRHYSATVQNTSGGGFIVVREPKDLRLLADALVKLLDDFEKLKKST